MTAITRRRKVVLGVVLLSILAIHGALFAAAGRWRTLAIVLLGVDIFSAYFVVVALRETRKMEKRVDR